MFIEQILLKDFRNFPLLDLKLNKGVNVFYGKNAQGKTNFLEAIYMCATGRSHRTHTDKELINFGKTDGHIQLFINKDENVDKIDVHLKKDFTKGIGINGLPIKKLGDLFGVILVVIFSPEDLNLIKAGPSERRKFINLELCQLSKVYYYELQQYYKILKQRNNLLKSIQKNKSLIDTISIWDSQLVKHGIKIIDYRAEFIKKINIIANELHSNITNGSENLVISYKQNVLSEDFENKLTKNLERDIYLGTTSVGIHKDDIIFYINDIDARIYGSQGQQRTAALSAKLAEIEIIKQKKDQTPIVLLDDVLSELDATRQNYILKNISATQTIITCTGVEDVIKNSCESLSIFNVENGVISFVNENFVV